MGEMGVGAGCLCLQSRGWSMPPGTYNSSHLEATLSLEASALGRGCLLGAPPPSARPSVVSLACQVGGTQSPALLAEG